MAQLRTIGLYIESSGLDDIWTESDIYGPATVKQFLEGKNMKRGLEAHVTTLQALFSLYAEKFFIQHPKLNEDLQSHVKAIDEAWEKVRTAHFELTKLLESSNVTKKLNEFDKKNEESSPVFKFARHICIWCSLFYGSSTLFEMLIGTYICHHLKHSQSIFLRMIS